VQLGTFGCFSLYLFTGFYDVAKVGWVYLMLHVFTGLPLFYLFRKYFFYRSLFTLQYLKELLKFGRYSLGTQLFMNLLKTSDVLMIGFFIGPVSVVLYAVPLKLTEIFDIILRSISTHVYPLLIKAFGEQQFLVFRKQLFSYIIVVTLVFIAVSIVFALFSEELLYLIGGAEYEDATALLFVFLLANQAVPYIRLSGVAFEAVDKPAYNFYRYGIMLFVNIVLNLLCFYLKVELLWIAIVNLVVASTGVLIGRFLLQKSLPSLGKCSFLLGYFLLVFKWFIPKKFKRLSYSLD
jgi:O-antigen/teichoic acid export membrane protein